MEEAIRELKKQLCEQLERNLKWLEEDIGARIPTFSKVGKGAEIFI